MLATPVAIAAAVGPDRLVLALAWGLALAAHAGALYVAAREPADTLAGAGGQQLDAISVTLVSSTVLEARKHEQVPAAAPAAVADVDESDGTPDSTPSLAQREQKDTQKEPKKDEEPVPATEAIALAPPEPERQRRQESAPAPAAGGAAVRGDAPAETKASAPAAASPGAVREYARYVSQALGRTRPKGTGGFGTAQVKFTIAPSGALASIEVAKSSGSKRLDDTALAAVQRAAFPVPPAGMTVAQLTFVVPYHFR
jgi:protein TonB